MSYFTSKMLIAAKAMAQKDWTYPSVLLAARHMADSGKSVEEIKTFLGWDIGNGTAAARLKKYRIMPFSKLKKAHRGQNTGFGESGATEVNQASFKAREYSTLPPQKMMREFKCSDCGIKYKQPTKGPTRRRCRKCAIRHSSFLRSERYVARKAQAINDH